tara:strand:- start:17 stop:1219 length:1203 start_codon:yes stop_codon:yes gene_type:complete
MADKAFGVDQLDILGTGTPTISAPNQLNLDCHTVAISTSVTVGANLTVNGNIDLGNASSDTISLTGVVDTNIIPSADSSKDIGSNTVRFANGYFDTVHGSGANLTSLPAANLTGTLPAISGANLTNLPTTAGIWTVTNNSSSNYVISGPGGLSGSNNPDLYLERGKTYQFSVNASGHPFGIQTVSGTWTGSDAYTTGITNAGAAVGTITFAVPYSAPERLYYACTSQHSGMVGNIYIQGGPSDIKMCDQWRRAAVLNTNNGENFITTDWERVDGSGQGTYTVNGGMSESGGIFTFPRTGIYLVTWQAYGECTTTSRQNAVNIYITTNNNIYANRASSVFSIGPDLGTYNYAAGHCSSLVDVTDTSQVKVKFRVFSSGNVSWDQSGAENRNAATFLRIGDT